MEPTPQCIETVIQSSALLQWLHTTSASTLVVILIAEVVLHIMVFVRFTWLVRDTFAAVWKGVCWLNEWRKYRALPLEGRVMYHWHGNGAWWTPHAKIWIHCGKECR